mmetsp:Transcript_14711/g.20310  ORF Transcript_14711/g.20310 Transcript_14711/m.20310 type:complete len:96 (-) Transcript_14711:13-300(-)
MSKVAIKEKDLIQEEIELLQDEILATEEDVELRDGRSEQLCNKLAKAKVRMAYLQSELEAQVHVEFKWHDESFDNVNFFLDHKIYKHVYSNESPK